MSEKNNKVLKTAFAVILGAVSVVIIFFFPWLLLLICVITAMGICLRSLSAPGDRRFLFTLFVSGLSIRIIAALIFFIVSYGSGLFRPDSVHVNPGETVISGDAAGYSAYGWILSEYWKGERNIFSSDDQVALGKYFFTAQTYLSAMLYYLFGYIPLLGIILNCLAGVASAFFIFFIAQRCCGAAAARIAAALTMFWPSIFLWSVNNSKEPMSILSMLAVVLAGVAIYRKFTLSFFILFSAAALVFIIYQPQLAMFSLLWIGLIFLIKVLRYPPVRTNMRGLILACVILLLLANLFVPLGGFVRARTVNLVNATISRNSGTFLTGGNVYKIFPDIVYTRPVYRTGSFTSYMTPFTWLKALLKGLFYFLFSPFPWSGGSLLQSMARIEILLWYALIPFFFAGIFLSFKSKKKDSAVLAAFLIMVTSLYSLAEANVGTTFRHRSVIMPLYFIFIASAVVYFAEQKGDNVPVQ
ncbi:MAG: hypothetical protein PHE18_03150 [Candidatus Omnitrophica bacterium]|nr:hypothetical protein [Candidatus Omnitrophota bacterium]MDD5552852.1 hypothetical protein [Candidatus Omnitrophota bacterium]